MKSLKEFSLYFKNLSKNEHKFFYKVTDNFFTFFPYSRITKGDIEIQVNLFVKRDFLLFLFDLQGTIDIQCDVCLDWFKMPIKYKAKLNVNFSDTNSDITDVDETIILSHSATEIQLSQHIYEYIHLAIPTKVVHPLTPDGKRTCNKDMLKKLNEYQEETTETKNIDPRWGKLLTLINN